MLKEAHFTPERMLSLLRLKPGSLGKVALIPGPKERSQRLLQSLEKPNRDFSFLDYEMHTGSYAQKRVTVGNGGRYAADTAITTEILCAGGVDSLIRLGSCGSLQKNVKIGDFVVVTGAVRGEGTTPYYVPKNFSATAHKEIIEALSESSKKLKVRYHLGWVFTTDALFQETPQLITELEQQGVTGIDMVTSAFLTVAQVRHKKAGAILTVSDECLNGKMGFRDPQFLEAEEKMIVIALEAAKHLS